jgi:hypothetical protein
MSLPPQKARSLPPQKAKSLPPQKARSLPQEEARPLLDNDLSVINSLQYHVSCLSMYSGLLRHKWLHTKILSLGMRGSSVNNFIILINEEFHPWPTCGSVLFQGNYTSARFPEDCHPQSCPNLCFGLGFKWASRCGSSYTYRD